MKVTTEMVVMEGVNSLYPKFLSKLEEVLESVEINVSEVKERAEMFKEFRRKLADRKMVEAYIKDPKKFLDELAEVDYDKTGMKIPKTVADLFNGYIIPFINARSQEERIELFKEYWNKIDDFKKARLSRLTHILKPNFILPLVTASMVRIWEDLGVSNPYNYVEPDKPTELLINNFIKALNSLRDHPKLSGFDNDEERAIAIRIALQDYYSSKQAVDETIHKPTQTNSNEQDQGKIKNNLNDFFQSKGYLFPSEVISQFYTALKTKGFVILSGLTGSGKTKIALEFAELINSTKLFLSVRPDWRDSKPLVGWYNPLTEKYEKTELLDLILKATNDKENPYFIILDEMNLAHVEYYFSDFLSVLESGRDEEGFTRESIKLHSINGLTDPPKEVRLPPNLYIIGTVNVDETTYAFSPKVLDRAFTIEFHDVLLKYYPPEAKFGSLDWGTVAKIKEDFTRQGKFLGYTKGELNEAVKTFKEKEYWHILTELNEALEPYDMHFGYRVVDEIAMFFRNALESWKRGIIKFESESEDEIFDLAILMKILPKFHGNRKKIEKPLNEVLKKCLAGGVINVDGLDDRNVVELLENWNSRKDEFRFKHTAKKVLRMLRQLNEIGFASFS